MLKRRDELKIGGEAGVDPRTVRKVYVGQKQVHPVIVSAICAAAMKLGYPLPASASRGRPMHV